ALLAEPFHFLAELFQLGQLRPQVVVFAEVLVAALDLLLQRLHGLGQVCRSLSLLVQLLLVDDRHEQKDAKKQQEHVDERDEKARHAPPGHGDHGASPGDAGRLAPSARITSRPIMTVQVGRILTIAMNSPLPVAVMAGEYCWKMICVRKPLEASDMAPSAAN